jgi:hypothetical protein
MPSKNLQDGDHKMELFRADKAPKDGTIIMADFGHQRLLPAMWNAHDKMWSIATPQTAGDDCYFENDQMKDAELKCWTEYPKLPKL